MEKYTDQEFFYKQTPVNYDGIAKFTSIKGNTLGWNQLVQNGNFESIDGWGKTRVTLSASNNELTATVSEASTGRGQRVFKDLGINDTHTRLYSVEMKATSGKTLSMGSNTQDVAGYNILASATATGSWQKLQAISSLNHAFILFGLNNDTSIGDSYQVRNVQVFDLTQMGLDSITSVDEFTSLFPLPYYDYNQGTLIPFSGNGIKTTGKNLFPYPYSETTKTQNGLTFTDNGDGTITVNGTATAQTYFNLFTNTSEARPKMIGGTYVFSNTNSLPMGAQVTLTARKSDGTAISSFSLTNNRKEHSLTIGENFEYNSNISVSSGTTLNNYVFALMFEFGSTATSYEPYTSTTTDLPISTYFPTGMKSAGSVYDELTENKAITRVKQIIFDGSSDENWIVIAGTNRAYIEVSDIDTSTPDTSVGNIMSNLYVAGDYNTGANVSKITTRYNVAQINVFDSTNITSSSTVATWKAYLQEHPLIVNYELATETETDAEDIFYKFYADGTEQLLPVNGSTPTTSYLIADIEYYDSTEGDSLYRRFWLINGDGERWDLTDKEFRSFLNNPTGLGFRKTIEITRYGEKANKNNEVYDFPQPSGELLFYDTYNSTRYDKYNKFIRFLMRQPITLYYMIPVSYISGIASIFTLDCDVTEVQKTESKTDHILTSSIVFNGLGFYEGDEISVNGTTNTYTLTNDGDFPVGFEITVEGNMTNPYITLSQDGELYGEAKFDSATAFNSLYLNSNDGEQNIILQQGGSVIPNPLSYQDLSISNGSIYVTFVKLAKGVSELSIGVESGTISNVNIKYSPKYRSV